MTIIVATSKPDVLMASDRIVVSVGGKIVSTAGVKVAVDGGMLVGVAGGFRECQVILRAVGAGTVMSCVDWPERVRQVLREAGCLKAESGTESMDAEVIVAWKAGVFYLGGYFDICDLGTYGAIGDGAPYALGYLESVEGDVGHRELAKACKVAERRCAAIRGPFEVVSLTGREIGDLHPRDGGWRPVA